MFGISTSWKTTEIKDGNLLMDELEKTGIPGVELEYRISGEAFNQIKKRLQSSSLRVLSLHNFCPHPEILPIEKASGDAFSLSSLDEKERRLAVQYSIRTIYNAHELGAKVVVLHLGKVAMERESERWFELLKNGGFQTEGGRQFFSRKVKKRAIAKPASFEVLLKSLDQLNEEADKLNIRLGVENRYYWDQLPGYDEIGEILNHFKGGKIGYWHDVGHAQAQEAFGLAEHEEFLKAYSNHLIGVHLHDSQRVGYNDHFAPGSGLIDFDMVKKYLGSDTTRIIEAHAKVSADELQQGVQFLNAKGII